MEVVKVEKLYAGCVQGADRVILAHSAEEAEELKRALAVVARYEQAAKKAAKVVLEGDEGSFTSDWVMYSYEVGEEVACVTVTSGACG